MSWIVLLIVAIAFAIGLAVKPIAWWEGKWGWLLPVPVAWFFFGNAGLGWEFFAWVAVLTAEYNLARWIRCALASKPPQWWNDATAADVRSALRRGSDVNAMNGAALLMAACYSDAAVVELLIEKGADMTQTDLAPLCHVARRGKVEAIAMLLDHGADINMPGLYGTPLCHAVEEGNVEAIAMLLDRGADVDRSANAIPGSPTPLWRAARRGNVEAIAMLLDHGADASIPGHYYAFSASVQAFPLEIAVRENNWAAAGMLLLSRAAEYGLAPCVAGLSSPGSCRARMHPSLDLCPTCATPQWFVCPSCGRRVRGQQFEEPGEWRQELNDKLVSTGDCIPCALAGVRSWEDVPSKIKERLIGWGLKPPAIQPPRSARFQVPNRVGAARVPTPKPSRQLNRRDRTAMNRGGGEGAKYGVGAIPTMFRGRQYRSRLEARWAAFMSLCGWEHEYEPLDFNGWIPDFAIWGDEGSTVWVEVKPVMEFPRDVADKVEDGLPEEYHERGDELLILGVRPPPNALSSRLANRVPSRMAGAARAAFRAKGMALERLSVRTLDRGGAFRVLLSIPSLR